ncbi:hypothetical protein [Kutzneria albida]|uniref:Pyridoxal-phosphate dependent enzyme n=1 Tax=Kutzneria albida DSM 43870 TaxID=1449976 RepID=W5W947_9PSEU|nr:hypothetical protein [Kutzneria albida]AHH94704.1 hypothetical protein KALB_1331 [Kutzneria albida DSM 43870]
MTAIAEDRGTWVDSVLSLVGDTPCVRVRLEGRELALKLEGFNPTGTLFDRVAAHGRITSPRPHVCDGGPLAASLALLVGTMRIPLTYHESRPTVFGAMASALGAEPGEAVASGGFELDLPAVHAELREEVAEELGEQVRVLVPALPGLEPDVLPADLEMRTLLGSRGILVDARSAAVVRQALSLPGNELIAVVCLADGALDQDGLL